MPTTSAAPRAAAPTAAAPRSAAPRAAAQTSAAPRAAAKTSAAPAGEAPGSTGPAGAIAFGVTPLRPALISIDAQRGHLDAKVATMPVPPEEAARLIGASQQLMAEARAVGVPVLHVLTRYRDADAVAANPFWRTRHTQHTQHIPGDPRRAALLHNVGGGAGTKLAPQLVHPSDHVFDHKIRDDAFFATGLDAHLRAHAINAVILCGVATNASVLATAIAAHVRDYAVIVAAEATATFDDPALHQAALEVVAAGFGWVLSTADIVALARTASAHEPATHDPSAHDPSSHTRFTVPEDTA